MATPSTRSREREKRREARVFGGRPGEGGFDPPISAPGRLIKTLADRTVDADRAKNGPRGRARAATFPAQAQVAAWWEGGAPARAKKAAGRPEKVRMRSLGGAENK